MPSSLRDICLDCTNPARLARFWSQVLGYDFPPPDTDDPNESLAIRPREQGIRIWFNSVPEPKSVKNRVHIDINMPDDAEMDWLIALGATKLQEIRGEDGELWWTIMADPEGNEFCAFPPRGS